MHFAAACLPVPYLFLLGAFLFLPNTPSLAQSSGPGGPIRYVDPFIGTGISDTESARLHSEAQSEMKAQTFPAVGTPFAQAHWTPQTRTTEQKCISPYYHMDTRLSGFRASRWMSGSCTQDYGSVTVMPLAGRLQVTPGRYASAFSHASETASPAYYAVTLADYDIRSELTAGTRVGMLQFTFGRPDSAWVVVQPNSDEGEGFVEVRPDRREIVGYNPVHRIYQGWGQPAGFSGYFVIQFDQDFAGFGTFRESTAYRGTAALKGEGKQIGAFVRLALTAGNKALLRVGTSLTSLEAARQNLQAEVPGWDFGGLRAGTEKAWNGALGKAQVKSADPATKTMFYTALYHAMLLPRIYSDHDGSYPAFASDYKVKKADGFTYHGDFSLWDTYRAVQPLYTLLAPERTRDMVQTVVHMAEEGQWLPIFPCWNSYTSAMIGDHAASVIADAYVKGITDFDADRAFAFMWKNATQVPASQAEYLEGKGRRALPSYLQHGFVPLEDSVWDAFHKREQVSRTLEYAYDDFAIAQLARALGKKDEHAVLLKRAANYKNVFDPATGFVRGRHADGSWVQPFDPNTKARFITEGTPWQYTYSVQQDVPGLIKLMGGKEKFIQRLDAFFDTRQYWHGNEPSHHIAYLYAYAGAPWKTQQRLKEIIRAEYGTGPGGISGNDDTGQMSAWYAFSAMGFYPVCPGTPYYVIGAPVLEEIQLTTGAGTTFTIRAPHVSAENCYVQAVRLNGKPYRKSYLAHADILAGGRLEFVMGNKPNMKWASRKQDVPPGMHELPGQKNSR
jgi:predicted alpha-1,2-mannosidase